MIAEYGMPIIISSDRTPVPHYVEKVSSSFGSKIFSPRHTMLVKHKQRLTEDFEMVQNSHQMDSLAAAIKAWKAYRKYFEKNGKTTADLVTWLKSYKERKA